MYSIFLTGAATLTLWLLSTESRGSNFTYVFFQTLFCELQPWAVPVKVISGECHITPLMMSTLVQLMAWCRQATGHYLGQFWLRSHIYDMVSLDFSWAEAVTKWLLFFRRYFQIIFSYKNWAKLPGNNPILVQIMALAVGSLTSCALHAQQDMGIL